jgi:hypothetical protein
MRVTSFCLLLAVVSKGVLGYGVTKATNPPQGVVSKDKMDWAKRIEHLSKAAVSLGVAATLTFCPPALALDDRGASSYANAKITSGGASTLQTGRTISITRGVNLDN